MTSYNSVVWLTKILRGLLKDILLNNNNAPAVWSYDGDITFTLPDENVSEATIVVKKNGIALADSDWSYNSSTNEITITASLVTNDTITITYSYYDKYSDTELKDFIQASLSYFSQYGYHKLFTLNTDEDEVITYNGENPNLKEAYQIAIITNIVIDPRNVNIDTREFKISAEEDKSKSDLLGVAFQQFMNYTGEISFIPDLVEGE